MNTNITQFTEPGFVEAVTIYVFLLIITTCFIKYLLFKHNTNASGVQKIIGGLAVFVVALLSNHFLIQGLSLFIGGLIIASEEFMQKLAIIVRSQSQDIGQNLLTTQPTKKEIDQKREDEVDEIRKTVLKKSQKTQHASILKTVILAESLVSDYFKKKLGNRYRENIKFTNNNDYIADGVIFNSQNEIIGVVEIKQLATVESSIVNFRDNYVKIRKSISDLPLLFCFVFEKELSDREIIKLTWATHTLKKVEIGIFSLKDNKLHPIFDPTIENFEDKYK